jgi:2'-5' RNA ligase
VLYVGLAQSESLASLAAWVEERVTCAGLAPEQRPFHPHLTLGRFREGAAPIPRDRLEMSHGMMQESIAVDRIGIFRSHLEPAGARYELLQEFPLLGDERR